MSVTHNGPVRDDMANAVGNAVDAGSGTAVMQIKATALVLIEFDLPDPAFTTAVSSNGQIDLNGTPIATTADAAGIADNVVVNDKDGTLIFSGSVTGTGGGGDLEVSNVNIALGQDASLDSTQYTAAV